MSDTFRKQYRQLSEEEKTALEYMKARAEEMLATIDACASTAAAGDARCFALARTKLEEAVMWAVKGITA